MPINNPGPSTSAVANTRAALSAGTYAFAQLPPASQYPAGTTVWTTDRGQFISNGSSWLVSGSLAGTYTYGTLPAASSVNVGASAYTSDYGMVVSNGTSWVISTPSQATVPPGSSSTAGVYSNSSIPLSKSDSRVLVDIGISSSVSKNLWTSLPAGWTYTSSTGSSVDVTSGFIAGAGNNAAGRITSANSFDTTNGQQGTIYVRVDKRALCADQSKSTTSAWYNSTGTTVGAEAPNYPPALWSIRSSSGSRWVSLIMGSTVAQVQDLKVGTYARIQTTLINAPIVPSSSDATYWDVVFTWSGTSYYLYIDGEINATGTLGNGAFDADQFYQVTIGNGPGGPNANLGGNLGPYAIQRFQVNTAYCPPVAAPITVAVFGDSYVAGSGAGGDGGAPNVATIATINAANALQNIGTAVGGSATGVIGNENWAPLLQSYSYKDLNLIPSIFSAAKSGYSSYFSGGYTTPIDDPTAATPLTVYSDAINAAMPSVAILFDSVNNQLQAPNLTGQSPIDAVGDLKWRVDYWAANNPNLRAILIVEALSLELFQPVSLQTKPTAAIKAMTAYWRSQLRSFFSNGAQYMAAGRVPVTYVQTYEQTIGATDANLLWWGTNPNNIATSGSPTGPYGATPDIHLCPYGRVRLANIVWTALKPILKSLMPLTDSGVPYNGGTLATITPNCAQSMQQIYTVSGNATINAPVNAPNVGARLSLTIIKSTASLVTLTWNAAYRNAPIWSAGSANTRATADFRYDGVSWQFIGGSSAFA